MKLYAGQHIRFLLKEVVHLKELLQHHYFSSHDEASAEMILDVADTLAEKYLLPVFKEGDRAPASWENGKVQTHPGVKEFVKNYAESGLLAARLPMESGGLQVPQSLLAAAEFIQLCSHNSLPMFTDLVKGCADLIESFGTTKQKETYLPEMLAGKWMATMCLTEPQAGSSLSEISTTAYKQEDGTYLIEGQKIFISAGDQDFSENIIHLVLARIKGAPAGVKGISLFIVPKNNPEECTLPNDVKTIGIFHKMGQKATPAVHLAFGENGNCRGYLLGEPDCGLIQMFQMMNGSRLGVGLTGIALSSAAYHHALQYAKERVQGRGLKTNEPVAIIQHPDVRRMLLTQKVIYEGGLALHLQCYRYLDLVKAGFDASRHAALLELLTPVCKTYGSEMGIKSVNLGLQVLGGYGYTEDFPLEQMARDVRILSIYEGTTAIQSLALLGRQVPVNNGESLNWLLAEMAETRQAAAGIDSLRKELELFEEGLAELERINRQLFLVAKDKGAENYLAEATSYMEFFGLICLGWQWLKMGVALQNQPETYRNSLRQSLRFFYTYEFTRINYLSEVILNTEGLTLSTENEPFNP